MVSPSHFRSIPELLAKFPDNTSCITHLESLRWDGKVVSPFSPESAVYRCKNSRYRCKNTGKYFTVLTGTLFENTKLPLQTWFLAVWLVTSHKKGISSCQLARDLNVTQKTSWFILQRLRHVLSKPCFECLSNEVEIDETYVGGKNKNRHASKKVKQSQGRSAKDKVPVLGMVERSGRLIAEVVSDVTASTLMPKVASSIKRTATIHTDEWMAYRGLSALFSHKVVKHGQGEYAKGDCYTNTIEGFWSLLKRGISGIYHFVSKKHLQHYLDEFVFRYNTRKIPDYGRVNILLANSHHRLTYKQLTHGKEAT